MNKYDISEAVRYIGVNDYDIDLFESQYEVPEGMAYNSYVIFDEKIAVMDTADRRKTAEWLDNLEKTLDGKKPDYVVISHMEPDHTGSLMALIEKSPDIIPVGNAKTFQLMGQFFEIGDLAGRAVTVKEGDTLSLGSHTLKFIFAPMVHWPEVMFSYEESEKLLFSADAFGKFGTLDAKDDDGWACEARRYYFNIVGKYGMQVQNVLKKLAGTEVKAILPLHGPALTENLEYYLGIYNTWSSYQPEDKGVLVAYASIHGNTRQAAEELGEMLTKKGAPKVVVSDLAREDIAEVIEDAFRYDKMILMAPSYDAGVFPIMEEFLCHLRDKAYQNRKVAMVENGSWAPSAARVMKTYVEKFKNVELVGETVTIRSSLKPDTREALEKLADAVINA